MDRSSPADKNSSYRVSNNDASTAPSAAEAEAVKGQEKGQVVAINGKAATPVTATGESTGRSGKKSSSSTTSPSPSPSPSSPSQSSSFVEESDTDNDNDNDNKNINSSDSDDDEEDAMMSSSGDESEPGDDYGDEKKSVGRGTSKNYDSAKATQSTKSNVELSSTAVAASPAAKVDRAVADGSMYTDKDVLSGRGGATNLVSNHYLFGLLSLCPPAAPLILLLSSPFIPLPPPLPTLSCRITARRK